MHESRWKDTPALGNCLEVVRAWGNSETNLKIANLAFSDRRLASAPPFTSLGTCCLTPRRSGPDYMKLSAVSSPSSLDLHELPAVVRISSVTGGALPKSEIINSWNPTSLFAVRFLKLINQFLRSRFAFAFALAFGCDKVPALRVS